MPEVWVPYGSVETLITIQAENLGTIVEPAPEKITGDAGRFAEFVKRGSVIYVCDLRPPSIELLRDVIGSLGETELPKVAGAEPKKVEAAIPELKGKVVQAPRAMKSEGGDPQLPAEMLAEGHKVFMGTALPDPLFGIIDAKVQACLNWAPSTMKAAAGKRRDFEPAPFERSGAYEVARELTEGVKDASFLTAIPRGGRVRSVLEDAPFDAIRKGFFESTLPQTRGIIVGAGGRGYDDTFSAALRSVWNVLPGVRKSGVVVMLAECSDGLGSPALEMLVSGRISGEGDRRRERYVDGLEEIYYLSKLKEEFDVMLLSGLPEFFARNKLGLTTAKGSGEAVGRLLNKLGRTAKVNVVPRATECRIISS